MLRYRVLANARNYHPHNLLSQFRMEIWFILTPVNSHLNDMHHCIFNYTTVVQRNISGHIKIIDDHQVNNDNTDFQK